MSTPYLDELVRRLRLDHPGVTVDVDARGAATVVWPQERLGH